MHFVDDLGPDDFDDLHPTNLWRRCDLVEGLARLGLGPCGQQVRPVERRPPLNETQRPARQLPSGGSQGGNVQARFEPRTWRSAM